MNLFEWTKKHTDWQIVCPSCKAVINLDNPPEQGLGLLKNKLKCNHNCSFEIDTSWIWYKIKASSLVEQLLMRVPECKLEDAWEWVNIFKYNNPTYQISQKIEREEAAKELKSVLNAGGDKENESSKNVLSIGCNSGEELRIFSNDKDTEPAVKNIKSIVCVDISKKILESAAKRVGSFFDESRYSKIFYCKAFVENLPSKLTCYQAVAPDQIEKGDKLSSTTVEYTEKFDLVLALKLFQSSYFDEFKLRRALICIARQMNSGGRLIISFAKATEYISEDQEVELDSEGNIKKPAVNFVSGVYQPKGFTDSYEQLNKMVREVLFIGEYEDVSVYYGNEASYEYYISCKKI